MSTLLFSRLLPSLLVALSLVVALLLVGQQTPHDVRTYYSFKNISTLRPVARSLSTEKRNLTAISAKNTSSNNNGDYYDVYSGILKRVEYHLTSISTLPEQAISILKTNHKNQGFQPNGLHAAGRDRVMTYLFSLIESFDGMSIYFGTEQGEYFTYFPTEGVYREPGNSGYRPDDSVLSKYWDICVNGDDGSQENCQMSEGDFYVQCVDDCDLVKCPDQVSQKACQRVDQSLQERVGEEATDCDESTIKWCPRYTVEQMGPSGTNSTGTEDIRGFVPVSYHCIDAIGRFSQTPGGVLTLSDDPPQLFNNATCVHRDGTPVTRVTEGPFESCKEFGEETCNTTYTGVIRTVNYDPRVRPWYITTKEKQIANWSPPYPFHSYGLGSIQHIGITYSDPFYTTKTSEDGTTKTVFAGVLAVDYTLQKISSFLIDDFGSAKDTVVLVFEEAEPHYVVGISTGSNEHSLLFAPAPNQGPKIYRSVRSSDPSVLCTEDDNPDDCELVRVPATDFRTDNKLDHIASRAVQAHSNLGFPTGERITVKDTDDFFSDSYTSQSRKYSHAGLDWIILVASPIERVDSDSLEQGSTSFAVLILIATVGTIGCTTLMVLWFRNRKKRSVMYGDFRFTCAFILGCILLNLSSFMSLGENTDGMCMARMWSFNVCFVLTISPLYAKVFRVYRLLGAASGLRRQTMDHQQTILRALPIIAVEIAILFIFTIVDPPKAVETVIYGSGLPQQHMECQHETNAFTITQATYDCLLVSLGCFLSFLCRNLDTRFGETRQLLYGMYNIAFTGICFILLLVFADVPPAAMSTFRAVAILWGTVLTCAVFVLPRLIRLRNTALDSSTLGSSNIHISGVMAPSLGALQLSNSKLTPSQPFGKEKDKSEKLVEIEDNSVPKEDSMPNEQRQPPLKSTSSL